jgi:hypothetical protein
MTDPFDPAMKRALDAFTVPPLPADFADRLAACALTTPLVPALPPAMPARRGMRGGWRRGGTITAGIAAFSLVSAAAAATGVFGENIRLTVRNAPVISTIIARVAPEHPKRVIHPGLLEKRAVAPLAVPPADAMATAPPPPIASPILPAAPPRELHRELFAQRIADSIERREARRAANGRPARLIQPDMVAPRLRDMPPKQRAAIILRVQQIQAQREGGIPDPANRPARLAPEEREAMRDRLRTLQQERKALRAQENPVLPVLPADGAETAPVQTQAATSSRDNRPDTLRNADRAERMRILREIRERRRELRRQRKP